MKNIESASQIWKLFKAKPGSQHIASITAISALKNWLKVEKPLNVLEIGSGIGTLTYTIIKSLDSIPSKAKYTLICVEDNEYCRNELRTNLSNYADRFIVIRNISELPVDANDFAFVITDGGSHQDASLFSRLGASAFIFVEGVNSCKERQSKMRSTANKGLI